MHALSSGRGQSKKDRRFSKRSVSHLLCDELCTMRDACAEVLWSSSLITGSGIKNRHQLQTGSVVDCRKNENEMSVRQRVPKTT